MKYELPLIKTYGYLFQFCSHTGCFVDFMETLHHEDITKLALSTTLSNNTFSDCKSLLQVGRNKLDYSHFKDIYTRKSTNSQFTDSFAKNDLNGIRIFPMPESQTLPLQLKPALTHRKCIYIQH